ncbi:hypothetical protein GXP67_34450 [Rhodocytophaga rosea]|uniref:Uncharacterized protein n=1 Tax=Rhodocytophaga rosea TaxID=2704465 RepID=A0A6C0GTB0_9BACT|nr:hypothetical protein [Rhodocytophaga rosea]QHT71399.1 hypothetical protein GXP67_34450 [Rhodocytophaga rosea]
MQAILLILIVTFTSLFLPEDIPAEAPHWYRPTVYNDYIDFFDAEGEKVGRLAFDPASSKAHFTARNISLTFQTKGFYDGEIKIANKITRNLIGIIRKQNRKRNTLLMSDGRTYRIDLKEMTIWEDDVLLLQFQEKNKNEFVVQSYVHNEQEMLELNAILMYGRIAWIFSGGNR